MTEKEKMLSGLLYNGYVPELLEERNSARALTKAYNDTMEHEQEKRLKILEDLFGKIGPRVEIQPPFRCDYGKNIFAEDGLFINFGCIILDCNTVHIGKNVLIGPNVQIYAAHHPLDPIQRSKGTDELSSPIKIGDNVWIGGSVVICPGVTIGDNTTIGAGSVVTRDIPSNVIAAGNPCRIIRAI